MGARGAERQPHIYGATPLHFRQGVPVANADTPPVWTPEMAHHEHYPYTLEEWARDVRRWCFATKVTEERQANLLALALGGSARFALCPVRVEPGLAHCQRKPEQARRAGFSDQNTLITYSSTSVNTTEY